MSSSSSSSVVEDIYAWSTTTWVATEYPTALLFPTLPYWIALLPAVFRLLALLCFLPVIALTAVDIVGWTFFKLILRPLGWASTIRFKDPEPSTRISVQGAPQSARSPSRSRSTSKPSANTLSATAQAKPSSRSSSANSSASSSPVICYTDSPPLSPPRSHSPSLHDDGDDDDDDKGRLTRHKRTNSTLSTSSSISSEASINRARAPSVGVEGPLLFADDVLHSPRSGDELELLGEHDRDADEEVLSVGSRRAKMPRGGPAFGFTNAS